jgi:tRNA(Arg) A34 adenosine deaminase TadA
MQSLVTWTARRLSTPDRTPFGSDVVESATGRLVVRRLNAVRRENDPSSHAEVRAMRAACRKLRGISLAGHTVYTTCEPCPMCMSMALWAGVDRVVYGATIADAARFCAQIHIPSRSVAARSDMACVVIGPVARKAAVAIFEDPRMRQTMSLWLAARRNFRRKNPTKRNP